MMFKTVSAPLGWKSEDVSMHAGLILLPVERIIGLTVRVLLLSSKY